MKRVFMPLLALVFMLGLVLLLTTPALAAPGDHFTRQTKGLGADAAWNLYDEASGIQTDIQVYFSNDQERNPPDKPEGAPFVQIYISQYHVDEYVPIRDIWLYGEIPPEGIAVDRTLSSASLILSGLEGEQYIYDDDAITPITIDISLSWSAIGPTSIDTWTSHNRSPNGFSFYHSHGKSREANAQGTIVFGDTSITLDSPYWCTIYSAKTGIVQVYR